MCKIKFVLNEWKLLTFVFGKILIVSYESNKKAQAKKMIATEITPCKKVPLKTRAYFV